MTAGCGARSTLPDFNQDDASTGSGGSEVPCSTSRDALAFALEGDNLPNVYRILHVEDGSFVIVGEGTVVGACDRPEAKGTGTHFVARFDGSGGMQWERRFTAPSMPNHTQAELRSDGSIVLLVIRNDGLGPYDAYTGVVSVTPGGDLDQAIPFPLADAPSQALAVAPSRRVVVVGRCDPAEDPEYCPAGSGAIFSWDPGPVQSYGGGPVWGPGGGSGRFLGVAFDGEDRILLGEGTGSLFMGDGIVELGEWGTFIARIDNDAHLVTHRLLGTSLSRASVVIDPATRDVIVAGDYTGATLDFGGGPLPPASSSMTFVARLDRQLQLVHAQAAQGGSPHHTHRLEVGTKGEALVTFRSSGSGMPQIAGTSIDANHATVAIDRGGSVRWLVTEGTTLRFASEAKDGVRFFGGEYDDFDGPPGSGGTWPLEDKASFGYLYTLPPAL